MSLEENLIEELMGEGTASPMSGGNTPRDGGDDTGNGDDGNQGGEEQPEDGGEYKGDGDEGGRPLPIIPPGGPLIPPVKE